VIPQPWSHSAVSAFEQCPRQFLEIKVLKHFKDSKNAASYWGDEFHKAAEVYIGESVAGGVSVLPVNMVRYVDYLRKFIDRPGTTLVECKYSLDKNLVPCDFFSSAVWCRAIIDVLTLQQSVAWADDHKTGKNRKKDMQQLIICALMVFYHHPEINTVHTKFHWLQLGAADPETFYRHQIPALWETLVPKLQRYKAAFNKGIFPAKPSGLCKKNCAVETCEYWGSGRR
jgi:hypothetical protein